MCLVVVRHGSVVVVVVVGVPVVHVMVRRGPVRCVGRVAHGPRLWWGAVVMRVVGVALVLGHWMRGSGAVGVVVSLVVPYPLALGEWWSLCGVDRLLLVVGRGTAVRWR